MDLLGPAPDDKLVWAFMAAFERWVISKRLQYAEKWDETRPERICLEQFILRYRTDPAFDEDVLQRLSTTLSSSPTARS